MTYKSKICIKGLDNDVLLVVKTHSQNFGRPGSDAHESFSGIKRHHSHVYT